MRSNRTYRYFKYFVKHSSDLNGREVDVLISRLSRKTHEEIGKLYNLTEGRIRQIEFKALQKIRSKTKQLALFSKKIRG